MSLIFIGGVPRSGTSLIQKILDLHSNIYAGPEFDHLYKLCGIYKEMKDGIKNGRQSVFYTEIQLKEAFSKLILGLLVESNKKKYGVSYISEKTPSNALIFEQLIEIFPLAKFILVIRDPRANVWSFKNVAKRASMFGEIVGIGSNLIDDLSLMRNYFNKAQRFVSMHSESCYVLYYEKLLKNPQKEIQKVCDFIGISFESQMLELSRRESDASRLINLENRLVKAWAEKGMLEKDFDIDKLDQWKKKLNRLEINLISNYFSKYKFEILSSYQFNYSSSLWIRFQYLFRYLMRKLITKGYY